MKKTFSIILIFVLIILLSVIAYYLIWSILDGFKYVAEGFKTLKASTYVPLIFTLSTAILGLFVTLLTQARARKRAINEAHRAKKVELYSRLLQLLQNIQLASKDEFSELKIPEKELILTFATLRTEMFLWASPKVLNMFYNLTHVSSNSIESKEILLKIDPLYKAMRNDIGLSNFGLADRFFVRSILTDPTEMDRL